MAVVCVIVVASAAAGVNVVSEIGFVGGEGGWIVGDGSCSAGGKDHVISILCRCICRWR